MPTPSGRSNVNVRPWLPVFVFALIFAGSCALNAINIGFPVYWHPDEPGKALQLQTGNYNFFHPQLLLRLAMLFHGLLPLDQSTREIILAGRFASAVTAAVATTAFGIFVMRRFGIAFGIATAFLLALTPTVFLNAHFFKEDASLLMGIALVMLAIQSVDSAPRSRNIALLGAAVGLAASAKYIGVIMVVPAIAMLASKHPRWIDCVRCLICAAFVFVAINIAGILGSSSLKAGLFKEITHVTTNHGGISYGLKSTRTLLNFWEGTPAGAIAIWVAAMLLIIGRQFSSGKNDAAKAPASAMMDNIVVFTPLLLLAAAQFSMVAIPRYVLPATVLALVAAVWISASEFSSTRNYARRALPVILLAFSGAATSVSFATTMRIFMNDPRIQLGEWIALHLPADAKVATEFYAGLPTPENLAVDRTLPALPQTVKMPFQSLCAARSLSNLRELGYTHIAMSGGNFERFFDPKARIAGDAAVACKRFYEEVFDKLTPLYEIPRVTEVSPSLSRRLLVYDLRKDAAAEGMQK